METCVDMLEEEATGRDVNGYPKGMNTWTCLKKKVQVHM